MNDKPSPQWLGRPINKDDDTHDLETRAAIHEFSDKLPRHEAEGKAYESYVRDSRLQAAAHHLSGMKAAQGAGQMDEARKHGALYETHLKALGLNPVGPVPHEVQSKVGAPDSEQLYRFKGHGGDRFAIQDHKEAAEKAPEGEKLDKSERSCAWKLGERRCKNSGSRQAASRWWCHVHERHGQAVAEKIAERDAAKEEPVQKSIDDVLHGIYKLAIAALEEAKES